MAANRRSQRIPTTTGSSVSPAADEEAGFLTTNTNTDTDTIASSRGKNLRWRSGGRGNPFRKLLPLCSICLPTIIVFGIIRSQGPKTSNTSSPPILRNTIEKAEVWADYDVHELRKYLKCREIFKTARTIHSQMEWRKMRTAYVQVVGSEHSTVGSPALGFNGFSQPYYVEHNEKGRGIYANADIPKGALVWQNIRTARFSDGPSYRQFVMSLSPEVACDVLQWAYVTSDKIINCDLDEGSFCNNGGSSANMDLDEMASKKFPTGAQQQMFATRDIKKGEEILCNYGSFSSGDWGYFGL